MSNPQQPKPPELTPVMAPVPLVVSTPGSAEMRDDPARPMQPGGDRDERSRRTGGELQERSTRVESEVSEVAMRSAGQRRINVIWEYTQAFIAATVVTTVLAVSAVLSVKGDGGERVAAFVFMTGVANLVIGFYFGRTNHQRVGGIGGGRESEGR
jgi:hypothetical protein